MENQIKKSQFVLRLEKNFSEFRKTYGCDGEDVFSSPGRIELIGNHTDHNHGKVMVSTVDLSIIALCLKTDDGIISYYTPKYSIVQVDVNNTELNKEEKASSRLLIMGIVQRFKELGYHYGGVKIAADTTIYKGAGVSSSASFELLICQILNHYYNDGKIAPLELAKIAQYSETNYFGKPCGLLDQMGIALGGINYIDFADVNNPYVCRVGYTFENYDFILINTGQSHAKMTSYYASITDDMKKVSSFFKKNYLREISYVDFNSSASEIEKKCGEIPLKRAKHFFEENIRVETSYKALLKHDEDLFVRMIAESSYSSYYLLGNCYIENEKEVLPKCINKSKALIKKGATRVHGGGFAGTVLAIVSKEETVDYLTSMRKIYGYSNVRKVNLTKYGTRFVGKAEVYLHG